MKKQILKSALIAMAGVGLTLGGFSIASALPESVKIHQGKVAKITINILKFQ